MSRHHQKEPQSMGQSNCCCSKKPWANLGKTRTINNGRTVIISHGKTRIKSHGKTTRTRRINPMTPVLHCRKIKKFFVPADCDENVFQIICTLVKAQIDKAKQSGGNGKEINKISKDTLVNLLNISGAKHTMQHSRQFRRQKKMKFCLLLLHLPLD